MSNFRPIDSHVQFLDPRRPEGLTWPAPDSPLFRIALPEQLRLAANAEWPVESIAIESSGRQEDDAWLLRLAERERSIRGAILDLQANDAGFPARVWRCAGHLKARGIRLNPIDRFDLRGSVLKKHLRLLGPADLTLELEAPTLSTLADYVALAEGLQDVPCLLDNGGNPTLDGDRLDSTWCQAMRRFAALPNTYCKSFPIVQRSDRPPPPVDVDSYRPTLDFLWETFGEKRMIYGSNWPAVTGSADYEASLLAYRVYLKELPDVADQFFRENAMRAYGLIS